MNKSITVLLKLINWSCDSHVILSPHGSASLKLKRTFERKQQEREKYISNGLYLIILYLSVVSSLPDMPTKKNGSTTTLTSDEGKENKAPSTDEKDPMSLAISVIEKKTRNLEKRKV